MSNRMVCREASHAGSWYTASGFSRQIVQILKDHNVQYSSFDILSDEEVRQGLKTYSNWPTYPQVYVSGELLGGLDIIKELVESGELENTFPKTVSLENRLKSLINKSPVMLFMKGNKEDPSLTHNSRAGYLKHNLQPLSFCILKPLSLLQARWLHLLRRVCRPRLQAGGSLHHSEGVHSWPLSPCATVSLCPLPRRGLQNTTVRPEDRPEG
ncbi:hypothetical protein cypCar_00034830 [Cyprinus carpio]|nr:hypothetical protein cypCar_00034830 [Cyprinus carpio]